LVFIAKRRLLGSGVLLYSPRFSSVARVIVSLLLHDGKEKVGGSVDAQLFVPFTFIAFEEKKYCILAYLRI